MGHSERWQLGLAKVTAAFARGPAHFRSCLAKLCSTWWLVRSDKSTVSPTSMWTNTPPLNGSGQEDGVMATTSLLRTSKKRKKNQCSADSKPFTLIGVSLSHRKNCEEDECEFSITASLWVSKGKFWRKCFYPPAHHSLKKIYWQPNLEIFLSFCFALIEVLRVLTSHLCRQNWMVLKAQLLLFLLFSKGCWHIQLYSLVYRLPLTAT